MIPGLPNEIVLDIFKHFNLPEWMDVCCVCSEWNLSSPWVLKYITDPGLVPKGFPGFKAWSTHSNYKIYEFYKFLKGFDLDSKYDCISGGNDGYFCNYMTIFETKHSGYVTRLELDNITTDDVMRIAGTFPHVEILILESFLGEPDVIPLIKTMDKLRHLYIEVESIEHIWDFSSLNLDSFAFQHMNIQCEVDAKGYSTSYEPTNDIVKLPQAFRFVLCVDWAAITIDDIIQNNPKRVHLGIQSYSVVLDLSDISRKLSDAGIINTVTDGWFL